MEKLDNTPEKDQVQDSTKVEQVDVNIDELFGMPGAENVMLPTDEEKPKTMFTKETVDTSFLDKPVSKEEAAKKEEAEETIAELDSLISQEEDAGNKGRPKIDKSGLAELAQKMIEEGTLIPFDDEKSLEEYTTKDFRELFEANFQERENAVRESTPKEFFNALPEELQYAAKYVADGGQDLKGLFRTLAQVEEMYELDIENEHDQAEIARQYLHATQFGSPEEIESEIQDWYELGRLQQKAEQAKAYQDNVYGTLAKGDLGGLKLDRKVQGMLYSGLVQPNYPSISGKPTNLLGHLLEKYQFVEPRHDLIAEALWLLADPDGYKSRVKEQGGKQAIEKTVRQLKTEQSRKLTSSVNDDREYDSRTKTSKPQKTISRSNMFKRF